MEGSCEGIASEIFSDSDKSVVFAGSRRGIRDPCILGVQRALTVLSTMVFFLGWEGSLW